MSWELWLFSLSCKIPLIQFMGLTVSILPWTLPLFSRESLFVLIFLLLHFASFSLCFSFSMLLPQTAVFQRAWPSLYLSPWPNTGPDYLTERMSRDEQWACHAVWGTGQEILQGMVRSEAETVSGGVDLAAIRAALSPPGIEPASNGMWPTAGNELICNPLNWVLWAGLSHQGASLPSS